MSDVLIAASDLVPVPVHAVLERDLAAALDAAPPMARALAALSEFKAKSGQALVTPDADGAPAHVLFGLGSGEDLDAMVFRGLPPKLPGGTYRLAQAPETLGADQIALAFALGSYHFDRYKKKTADRPRLVVDAAHIDEARSQAHACALARDMINTPANDLGPLQIETIAREIAEQFGARITVIVGEGLLEANYPAVHAVGGGPGPPPGAPRGGARGGGGGEPPPGRGGAGAGRRTNPPRPRPAAAPPCPTGRRG
jgi:leucyl aminopeptidase